MRTGRVKVYISGPVTLGDREKNFQQAAEAHIELLRLGFAPLNPILTMRLPGCWDIPWETWLEADLPWVVSADAVLRLPGPSRGADMECSFATELGIPVYDSIEGIVRHFEGR